MQKVECGMEGNMEWTDHEFMCSSIYYGSRGRTSIFHFYFLFFIFHFPISTFEKRGKNRLRHVKRRVVSSK